MNNKNNAEIDFEKFNQIFLKNNYAKDILLVNVHQNIILWMFENSFKSNAGLSILQISEDKSSLERLIHKYKFKYILLPKTFVTKVSKTYSKITSFSIFETEYEFIEIKIIKFLQSFLNQ